jgi:hypothetical protein
MAALESSRTVGFGFPLVCALAREHHADGQRTHREVQIIWK